MSESKQQTLRESFGSVPDLIPNPVSSEAWVRRFRDGYDAGFEAGLKSVTRPSEAEVTELMSVGQCEACGSPTVSLARHICEPCKARALSTPPLPSAPEERETFDVLDSELDAVSLSVARRFSSGVPWVPSDFHRAIQRATLGALSTPPLPSAEPRDLSGYCVACGQEAGPHNTYGDAEGRHALNVYPNFSVCDSCLPSSDDTAPLTNEMEPEEAALRCWHNDFTNRCIPFEEIAEQLMRWTALRGTPPLPSAEPVAWNKCNVCLGEPLKSGRACICGGIGTQDAEAAGLRRELFEWETAAGLSALPRDTYPDKAAYFTTPPAAAQDTGV